jgi:hypothetical protein
VLFAQFLLRVSQVRLGLTGHHGARGADLTLHGRDGLAGGLAHCTGHAGDLDPAGGASTELLDSLRHAALVVTCLGQVLAQPLLVGLLLGQRDMSRQIGFELSFLGVRLVQPLDQLGVTLVRAVSVGHWDFLPLY